MNSKKKFIIALSTLGVVALGAIVALIAVIAAFNATTEGAFNVSYTAKNVQATVAAEYKVGAGTMQAIKASDGANVITFSNADEDEAVTKSFKSVPETEDEAITIGKDEYMYIHYTITNTDTTGATSFKVAAQSTLATNAENLTVVYANSENAETWEADLSDVVGTDSVENGTPLNIWVRISVTTKTKNASLTGNINFTLTVNE